MNEKYVYTRKPIYVALLLMFQLVSDFFYVKYINLNPFFIELFLFKCGIFFISILESCGAFLF